MADPFEYNPSPEEAAQAKNNIFDALDALKLRAWRVLHPSYFGSGDLYPAQQRHTREPLFISEKMPEELGGITLPWISPHATAMAAGYPDLFQDTKREGGSAFINNQHSQVPGVIRHELAHVIHSRVKDDPQIKAIIQSSGNEKNLDYFRDKDMYSLGRLKAWLGDSFPQDTEKFAYAFNNLYSTPPDQANRDMIFKVYQAMAKSHPEEAITLRRLVNRRYNEPKK